MKMLLLVVLGLFLLFGAMLYFGQSRMIYFPQRYAAGSKNLDRVETLTYLSDGKKQWTWLVRRGGAGTPVAGTPVAGTPAHVWWLFGGNGSVAWNWLDLIEAIDPAEPTAFVLFDYPGYGYNQGRPSPKRIARSVDEAFPRVAEAFGLSVEDLETRSRAMGHSLGAAVALDTARRYDFAEVIAIAPFTTMRAMAERQVGPLFAPMLRHHFDNGAAVEEWLGGSPDRRLLVYHGRGDRIVPFAMGEALAERAARHGEVEFVAVDRAGHNDIVAGIGPDLVRRLEAGSRGEQ